MSDAFGIPPQRPNLMEWVKDMAERVNADPGGPEGQMLRPLVEQLQATQSVFAHLPPHIRDAVDEAGRKVGAGDLGAQISDALAD